MRTADTPTTPDAAPAAELPPVAWRPVLLAAGGLLAILLALSGRYGLHRDELYFVAAGHRLDWGYPDQPPLTPLLARLADAVAPGSVVALHAPAAVLMAAVVAMAALLARELGGGRATQTVTTVTVGTGVVVVGLGHWLSTAAVDTFFWVTVTLLAAQALRRDQPRRWLAVGAVAGVGLLDKHLVAFLLAGLAVGVLATPTTRHHLRSPWTWAGAALAVAIWTPNLLWQAAHGWPQLELAADIRDEYLVLEERVAFVVLLAILVSPVATWLWLRGWRRLWRTPELAWAKPFAWAFAVLTLGFGLTGGKAYYLVGLLPVLLAAGADDLVRTRPAPRVRRTTVVLAAAAVAGWPIVLPVLPASVYASSGLVAVDEGQGEMLGWPEFVETVSAAARESGADVILTANYGEAGALEWYGSPAPVYSGHNAYGDWGPPPDTLDGPFLVVGYGDVGPAWATGCSPVARIDNGLDLENEEQDGAVLACEGTTSPWSEIWDQVVHLSA